jgi:hypothetical protein
MEANEANASLLKRQVYPFESKYNLFFLQNLSKFTPFASLYSDPAYGRGNPYINRFTNHFSIHS